MRATVRADQTNAPAGAGEDAGRDGDQNHQADRVGLDEGVDVQEFHRVGDAPDQKAPAGRVPPPPGATAPSPPPQTVGCPQPRSPPLHIPVRSPPQNSRSL